MIFCFTQIMESQSHSNNGLLVFGRILHEHQISIRRTNPIGTFERRYGNKTLS